jgi:hypothetical protein
MTVATVINALCLPADARVDQRVPKKLLVENGAATAADKRQINDGVEELFWVAALKPTNVGVGAFRDDVREYLEIAVLTATFRQGAKADRLVELIHRAIPYPLVLLADVAAATAGGTGRLLFSLAHLRRSQGEVGKEVVEAVHCTEPVHADAPTAAEALFLQSLAVTGLPRGDLYALYQGWVDRVAALEAARITGVYTAPGAAGEGDAVREGVEAYQALTRELAALRARAKREKQVARLAELNMEIKRREAETGCVTTRLCAAQGVATGFASS